MFIMFEKQKKPSKTAQLIQDSATKLFFAEKGYDGTIMDELASITGANKASIYYHFKNKQGLYEKCMTDLFSKVADQVEQAVNQKTNPTEQLANFITAFSVAAYANPQIPSALMREMATGGENMPVSARQQMQRLVFTLKNILSTGCEQGLFNPINPLTVHFLVIGSLCLYITSEPMRLGIQSDKKIDPSVSEMTDEVVKVIQLALQIKSTN